MANTFKVKIKCSKCESLNITIGVHYIDYDEAVVRIKCEDCGLVLDLSDNEDHKL